MKNTNSNHEMNCLAMAVSLAIASLSSAHAEEIQVIARTGKTAAVTFAPFKPTLAVNTPVWLNVDDLAASTDLRATQRSLGFREVDYKGVVSAALTLNAVKPKTTEGITSYDYSEQNDKGVNLVAFWKEKDLPIVIGPDGKAYITDGHHTNAGYLAAKTAMSREVVAGQSHVVLGHIAGTYFAASPQPVTDAWWQGMQAANNALLYGPTGNQLARPANAGFAGLQPLLPSTLAMPTVPGKSSMTNDDYRSLTWGMVDPIVKTASTTPDSNSYLKGFSKGFPKDWVNPAPTKPNPDVANDINFVEFYWADFLRNRIVWNNTLAGCALDATEPACNGKKNLIAAPISFFAAVANGIALARSESYTDQYGRKLSDYVTADYPANTRNWASASLQNGLAFGKQVYHMYLLDDSSIKGDITPSAVETVSNRLHIDTTSGQLVTGHLKNFAAVDINRGSTIDTKWKETPAIQKYLGVNPETSLVIEPGTGPVTFAGINTYPGPTTVAAGKLIIAESGELSGSASLEVMPKATLQSFGKITLGSYTQQPNATLNIAPNESGQIYPMTIAGTARLAGTLVLGNSGGNWNPGVSYTLLKASDIQGTFSVVTSEAKMKPTLKYEKTSVTLSFSNR